MSRWRVAYLWGWVAVAPFLWGFSACRLESTECLRADFSCDFSYLFLRRPRTGLLPTTGRVGTSQRLNGTSGGLSGGLEAAGFFGRGLAHLGDVDKDGVGDLAVGAWADDDGGIDVGALWILFMNADGTIRAQQVISMTAGGFSGSMVGGDYFGTSVAAIGDVDNDGIPDVAVGAPKTDDGGMDRGAVWVILLNANGTVKSNVRISSTAGGFGGVLANDDQFGTALAAAGDLDGDGVPDLLVGAIHDDGAGSNRGALWILYLNSNGTVKSQQKINNTTGGFTGSLADGDSLGDSAAVIGDLDGDGVKDLAVGAPGADDGGTDRGAVWILFMNSDETVRTQQKISNTTGNFTGALDDSDFLGGVGLAGPGDLDGDGVADMVVGATGDDDGGNGRGAAWVLFLNSNGTVKSHQKISSTEGNFSGPLANGDAFGGGIAYLGDLNGDLVPDILVGASGENGGAGGVWVLFLERAP